MLMAASPLKYVYKFNVSQIFSHNSAIVSNRAMKFDSCIKGAFTLKFKYDRNFITNI